MNDGTGAAQETEPTSTTQNQRGEKQAALELRGITKSYREGESRLNILKGANLSIQEGELVALVAPSGAGKSTLLHIAGLLENPDSGSVRIGDSKAETLDDAARTLLRRDHIGFVYQFHHLLPEFTALENIIIPQMINGLDRSEAAERAKQLMTYMNAIALKSCLLNLGISAEAFSALAVPEVCETFSQRAAERSLHHNKVTIFAGGTGCPYFSTDTAAALRAAELQCDAILKATQVDGIYSADPKLDPNAERFEEISHECLII